MSSNLTQDFHRDKDYVAFFNDIKGRLKTAHSGADQPGYVVRHVCCLNTYCPLV